MSQNTDSKLFFASDYMEGAHPAIMRRLMETNMLHSTGYGTDEFSENARALVRKACDAPEADVFSLSAERRPTGAPFCASAPAGPPLQKMWIN